MAPRNTSPQGSRTRAEWNSLISAICDGKVNLTATQAALFCQISALDLYDLVRKNLLHPLKIGQQLAFARSDLEAYLAWRTEKSVVQALEEGLPPIDVFARGDGRYRLKDVERIMGTWAKLAGYWIVETPRGSYARWLKRFGLERISPRQFRRLCEALLLDAEVGERALSYLRDQRALNGAGDEKAALRASRKRPYATTG